MRRSTRDFPNIAEPVDESRYIAAAYLSIASTKTPLAVASHRIDVATVALHEDSMLLAATHICDDNVETADFWQVVDHLLAANSQLAIVVV